MYTNSKRLEISEKLIPIYNQINQMHDENKKKCNNDDKIISEFQQRTYGITSEIRNFLKNS